MCVDIPRVKRQILLGRHMQLVDFCCAEIENLQMLREESISILDKFKLEKKFYVGQMVAYEYHEEYRGATQKEKIKQRMKGLFTEKLVDDILDGSSGLSDVMKIRNAFLWNRDKIASTIISAGIHPTSSDLSLKHDILFGDIMSLMKTLQLVEYICVRKSAKTLLTGEETDNALLVQCAIHIGYCLQYLRFLWSTFETLITSSPIDDFDDDDVDYFEEERLFEHITVLLKQTFSALFTIMKIPQTIYRAESMHVGRKNSVMSALSGQMTNEASFKTNSLDTLPTQWSWGHVYTFEYIADRQRPSPQYCKIVEQINEDFDDEKLCLELIYWLLIIHEYKVKSNKGASDVGDGDASVLASVTRSLSHTNGDGRLKYDDIFRRMLYQGSPLMIHVLSVAYNVILLLTMSPVTAMTDGNDDERAVNNSTALCAFPCPSLTVIEMMRLSLLISEYLVQKYSLHMSSEYGAVAFDSVEYLRAIDDEVIIAYKITAACFSAGIMFPSSAVILDLGFLFTRSRKDNYMMQVSWVNAIMLASLCLVQGGMTEKEALRRIIVERPFDFSFAESAAAPLKFLQKNSRQGSLDENDDDYEESSKRGGNSSKRSARYAIHQLLQQRCALKILELMNYHRHSLTLQHSGLLILRILFQPTFIKRRDTEQLITIKDFENIAVVKDKSNNETIVETFEEKGEGVNGEDINVESEASLDFLPQNIEDVDEEDDFVRDLFMKWRNKTFKEELSVLIAAEPEEFPVFLRNMLEVSLNIRSSV